MPKKIKPAVTDGETMVSDKFRTTPIKSTITPVKGLHKSAILYKCPASSYWQFRVFLEGKARKRSTQLEKLGEAERKAKLIYAEMLTSVNSSEAKVEPSSRKTLQIVANSLWTKNETRIKNGELNKDKVSKDSYIFEKHIKPFFDGHDIKRIDADLMEQFKIHLADQDLAASTQLSYLNLVMALLKEAQLKRIITHLPPKPRVRIDDGVRGYFDDDELKKLQSAAYANQNQAYEFKDGGGRVYRRVYISEELVLLIDFMVETYIRPTDIKVIRHQDVRLVDKAGITFLVLEHEKTKRHVKNMVSTERGLLSYSNIVEFHRRRGLAGKDNHLFMPELESRDAALHNLSTQFGALLNMAGMNRDRHGKPRTLYSLRHTAIVRSLRKGIPIELVASNARTSSDMIRRFYGVHVDNILETGSVYVDKEKQLRNERISEEEKLIAEMKSVSDTPEIYTFTAESMEQEQTAKMRELIATTREPSGSNGVFRADNEPSDLVGDRYNKRKNRANIRRVTGSK